ncbi:hypothetical protein BDF20DRAFT_914833 [Mycotypha africana]|uniref:uncharacterized protein n=1 Tax=Mycotypha africana TaxID=64632 RepID=UPI002301FB9C|nr:uncharacterized protein BDF20DRAFT_914833 [Mycotypha africana]KAI8973381.1 hypothetical protein BDF20DRAFT_914833 [Mycotypha africana]
MSIDLSKDPTTSKRTGSSVDFRLKLLRIKEHFNRTYDIPTVNRRYSTPITPSSDASSEMKLHLVSSPMLTRVLSNNRGHNLTPRLEMKIATHQLNLKMKSKRSSMTDLELFKEHMEKLAEAGFLPLGPVQSLQQPPPPSTTKKQRPQLNPIDTAMGKPPLRVIELKPIHNVPVVVSAPARAPMLLPDAKPATSVTSRPGLKGKPQQPKSENQPTIFNERMSDAAKTLQKLSKVAASDPQKIIKNLSTVSSSDTTVIRSKGLTDEIVWEHGKPAIIQFSETYKATMTKIRYSNYYPLAQRMHIKMFKNKMETEKETLIQQCEQTLKMSKDNADLIAIRMDLANKRLRWKEHEQSEQVSTIKHKYHTLETKQLKIGQAFYQRLTALTGRKARKADLTTLSEMNAFMHLMHYEPKPSTGGSCKQLSVVSPSAMRFSQQRAKKRNNGQTSLKAEKHRGEQPSLKTPQSHVSNRAPEQITTQQLKDIIRKERLGDDNSHASHLSQCNFDFEKHYPEVPPPLTQHHHIDILSRLMATDLFDYNTCKNFNDVPILQTRFRHTRYMYYLLSTPMDDIPDHSHPVAWRVKMRRFRTYQQRTVLISSNGTVIPLNAITKTAAADSTATADITTTAAIGTNAADGGDHKLGKKSSMKKKKYAGLKATAATILLGGSRPYSSLFHFLTTTKKRNNNIKGKKH